MNSLIEQLQTAGLRWSDDPILQMTDGHPFAPRAGIFRGSECITVICTFSDNEMERGLTTDITNARNVLQAETLLHLRPQAKSSFVGKRKKNGKTLYSFAPDTVLIGNIEIRTLDLCEALPTEKRAGWNDFPLGGTDLPSFDDMESFLSWWDFHPGKQSFEIIESQVVLTKGFMKDGYEAAGLRGMFGVAVQERVERPYHAFKNILVRLGEKTALCPDLVICEWDGSDNPFVNARAAVIFHRPNMKDNDLKQRVEWLRGIGVDLAILDPNTHKFTGEFGTKTTSLRYADHQLSLQDVLAETLDAIGFNMEK